VIEQVKALLAEQALTQAAIIDDAFDESPLPQDIEGELWDRFFDDLTASDEKAIATAYGKEFTEGDGSELRREAAFVEAVWTVRKGVEAAEELFGDYETARRGKRAALKPLEELLDELALPYRTSGRTADVDVSDVQILFLDLYLGYVEDEAAIAQAIQRLKAVVARRIADPPIVVLMSQSASLDTIAPKVRDQGELLGCQFRTLHKSKLKDKDLVSEHLHDLASTRPDALKLTGFIAAWDSALDTMKSDFLKEVRTLDLADYASAQLLKLSAEEEPLGNYMLDLFDQRLHGMLEGDKSLLASSQTLNSIKWAAYPPAQFMPSSAFLDLTDSLIFQHAKRTPPGVALQPQLGDVWMAPPQVARARSKAPVIPAAKQSRDVFAVLTQACDLQHGNTDRVLMLKGIARPYNATPTEKTPVSSAVMQVDEIDYAIDWNPLLTETWLLKELPKFRKRGFIHVRRLRLPYALQLQQAFIGKLGRVGTAAELPSRHAVGVEILLRTKSGGARALASVKAADGDAVCLVGRPTDGSLGKVEWLLLSDKLRDTLRQALKSVPSADLPPGGAVKLATVREDPELFRRIKAGLAYSREAEKPKRPFLNSEYDVVAVISADKAPVAGGVYPENVVPLLFEIDWD
jgi:hypothetical protein